MKTRPWEINEFTARVHKLNAKWWVDMHTGQPIKRNPYEMLALVVSELSECLEGERKSLMDDKLPHRPMPEVEMADAYIRLADYAGGFRLVLELDSLQGRHSWECPENKGEALFKIGNELSTGTFSIGYAMHKIEVYCQKHGYDLFGAVEEKLVFNAVRKDHTVEARRAEGGKKF